MSTSRPHPLTRKTKTFLLSAVAVSVTMWNLSFNLGAFGVIFFSDIFTAWVTASATFLACLLLPPKQSPVRKQGLLIMAFPTLGFLLSALETNITNPVVRTVSLLTGAVTYAFCLPYTLNVIFSITQSEVVSLSRKLFKKLILVALIIGLTGYFVGSHNYLFLSCFDFKISGNDLPQNCRKADSSAQNLRPFLRYSI